MLSDHWLEREQCNTTPFSFHNLREIIQKQSPLCSFVKPLLASILGTRLPLSGWLVTTATEENPSIASTFIVETIQVSASSSKWTRNTLHPETELSNDTVYLLDDLATSFDCTRIQQQYEKQWQALALDYSSARKLLSKALNELDKSQQDPIYVLCKKLDSQGKENLCFLGLNRLNQNVTALDIIYGVSDKSFTISSTHSERNILPDYVAMSNQLSDPVYHHKAFFEILNSLQLDGTAVTTDAPCQSSILLTCTWTGSQSQWNLPQDQLTAELQIYCAGVYADPESHKITLPLWEEVERLTRLDSLRQLGATAAVQLPHNGLPIADQVEQFILNQVLRQSDANKEALADSLEASLPSRTDLDFTDHWWMFASQAHDKNDLIEAFTAVIDAIESGRLQPQLDHQNATKMAVTLRDAVRNTVHQDALIRDKVTKTFDAWLKEDGYQALVCLLDAGIHKLKKDYAFHLTGVNRFNRHDLSALLENADSFDDQITQLHQLHHLLDFCQLLEVYLVGLPSEDSHQLLRQVLYQMSQQPVTEQEKVKPFVYVLPLSHWRAGTRKMLESFLSSLEPVVRTVTAYDAQGRVVHLALSLVEDSFEEQVTTYRLTTALRNVISL